jgi:hypothetical protein
VIGHVDSDENLKYWRLPLFWSSGIVAWWFRFGKVDTDVVDLPQGDVWNRANH